MAFIRPIVPMEIKSSSSHPATQLYFFGNMGNQTQIAFHQNILCTFIPRAASSKYFFLLQQIVVLENCSVPIRTKSKTFRTLKNTTAQKNKMKTYLFPQYIKNLLELYAHVFLFLQVPYIMYRQMRSLKQN